MHMRTQDALSYVKNFGKASLFITFTCNPGWVEIKECLLPGQDVTHRHDIIARVFHRKVLKLIKLPNAHIKVLLDSLNRIRLMRSSWIN